MIKTSFVPKRRHTLFVFTNLWIIIHDLDLFWHMTVHRSTISLSQGFVTIYRPRPAPGYPSGPAPHLPALQQLRKVEGRGSGALDRLGSPDSSRLHHGLAVQLRYRDVGMRRGDRPRRKDAKSVCHCPSKWGDAGLWSKYWCGIILVNIDGQCRLWHILAEM